MSLFLVGFLATGCKSSTSSSSGGSTSGQSTTTSAVAAGSGTAATSSSDCPTSNSTGFAKTKFVLHAGLAFGAFHRYLYKPLKAGTFKSGAHGRISAFIKAGLAALYIKREVRLTYADVKANPTLCKAVAGPLRSIGDSVQGAVSKLKSGDTSGITGLESAVGAVESKSASNGATVQEDANAPLK